MKPSLLVAIILVIASSCTKSPSHPDNNSNPPTDSIPVIDTTGNDNSPGVPSAIKVWDDKHRKVIFTGSFTYDDKHRVTKFHAVIDSFYASDYTFVYSSLSENYPSEYSITASNETANHKISFANGVPVRDTVLNSAHYSPDYTDIVWTKDSISEKFVQGNGFETKHMFFKDELLTNYYDTYQIPQVNEQTSKVASYTYTDTLNPFYLPYVAPFIEQEKNYFYYLNDLLFRKQTIRLMNYFYYDFNGTYHWTLDNTYDKKGQLVTSAVWRPYFMGGIEYLNSMELQY